MSPRSGVPGSGPLRRYFVARRPELGRTELLPGDAEHASRVLRIQVGDPLIGLDGRGGSWPLRVAALGRGRVEVESDGEGRLDPPPGGAGASLPWIEIAVPFPKGNRAEEMLDRLTQLGAAAIAELACERSGARGVARELEASGPKRARIDRVLREGCKQSGRTWIPELRPEPDPAPAELLLLEPAATVDLPAWIAARRTRAPIEWMSGRPLCVLVGPEGGFTSAEREAAVARGAVPVRLGPHVLRVETAAEAAMAILGAALFTPRRS